MSLATVTLSGTIKKNAEQKTTPNGNAVTNLMMDITKYDSRSKEEKSYPVKVTLWGDSYTEMLPKLTAGTRIIISGRLQIDQFADRNGKNIKLLNVEASSLNFVNDLNTVSASAVETGSYNEVVSASGSETDSFNNQEIPF
jgi:single-stranded DNA-binding protein